MKRFVVGFACCFLVVFLLGADSGSESEKSETVKKLTPSEYAWVALQVSDVSEAKKFFVEKLNFKGEWMDNYYLIQISDAQYLVLIERAVENAKSDGTLIAFHVKDVDAYFKQVTEAGVEAIDYLKEGKKLERPVWRDWGSKEFSVMGPENTVLVFTKMES